MTAPLYSDQCWAVDEAGQQCPEVEQELARRVDELAAAMIPGGWNGPRRPKEG